MEWNRRDKTAFRHGQYDCVGNSMESTKKLLEWIRVVPTLQGGTSIQT